jgi:hypothetical protein
MKPSKSVCVTFRGVQVIVTATGEETLLTGLAGRTFSLGDMLVELSDGRCISELDKKLYDTIKVACGAARVSVDSRGFAVKPLAATAGEIMPLVSAATIALRDCLMEHGWNIVSQSCDSVVKVVH